MNPNLAPVFAFTAFFAVNLSRLRISADQRSLHRLGLSTVRKELFGSHADVLCDLTQEDGR